MIQEQTHDPTYHHGPIRGKPRSAVWQRRRRWHPTPVFLPGKSHGRRSLVGCSPWGRKESDTTERLHFHFSLSCIGEGNGNPLQGSCLENPRDGGAWWAAVYGVTQSRTRLKWLSSRGGCLTKRKRKTSTSGRAWMKKPHARMRQQPFHHQGELSLGWGFYLF